MNSKIYRIELSITVLDASGSVIILYDEEKGYYFEEMTTDEGTWWDEKTPQELALQKLVETGEFWQLIEPEIQTAIGNKEHNIIYESKQGNCKYILEIEEYQGI